MFTRKSNLPVKTLMMCVGINLMAIGVSIYYFTGFGSDPSSVFSDGIHRIAKISYGAAINLFNGALVLLVFILNRKLIRPALFIHFFSIGTLVNFYGAVMVWIFGNGERGIALRFVLLLGGIVLLGLGVACFIAPRLGGGALETFLLLLTTKTNGSYRLVRTISDFTFGALGFLMGGKIGVATVMSILLTGSIVQFFRDLIEKNILEKLEPPATRM